MGTRTRTASGKTCKHWGEMPQIFTQYTEGFISEDNFVMPENNNPWYAGVENYCRKPTEIIKGKNMSL